jgi:flavin reductase (DIM6/NTAB) family NADH-FMN oxidoreductase RutF
MDLNSISLGMAKSHYTNAGIKENGTFSVSIPSIEMAQVSDYCGLVSGKTVDKSKLFDVFYGKLKTAPMIRKCPINMECRLMKTVDFPKHDVFIGEIVETYVDEEYLTDGIVDFAKVQPILFVMNDTGYWKLGQRFANAWDIGKSLKSG